MTPSSPAKVLIVDDDPRNCNYMKLLLATHGYDVEVARDGEHGLDLARRWDPEVIWMDVVMPGMDGLETTRRLRQTGASRAHVVIYSVRSDALDETQALAAGANESWLMPIGMREIIASTERGIARLRQEKRL